MEVMRPDGLTRSLIVYIAFVKQSGCRLEDLAHPTCLNEGLSLSGAIARGDNVNNMTVEGLS